MEYMPRTKWVLRFLGLWYPTYEDKTFKIRQNLYIALLIYNFIGIGTYPLVTINDSKIPASFKFDNLLKTIFVIIFTYNYMCTIYLRNDFMLLYEKLDRFGDFGKPPNFEKVSKITDIISITLCIYCTMVGVTFGTIPFIQFRDCIKYNELHNSTMMCGYALSMKFPYNIGNTWLYYLHLFIQVYCGTTMCSKGVLFFGLIIGCFEGIIVRLNHLILMLREVYSDDDYFKQRQRLRKCVFYHIHIIELAKDVNKCISLLTIPCLVTYNIIIGTSLLVLLNIYTVLSFVSTVGWVTSLFIGCVSGERIISTSMAVGEVAYDLKWYVNTRLRKDLQLMILRSQKPIRLQCGELGELSLASFKKIMQGAYTYATMKSGIGR